MPALDQITIKGYKSIKDATVELRSLNVLIGANGAGKSNFISFFRFLSVLMRGKLQDAVARQGGSGNMLFYGSKVTDKIYVSLIFSANEYQFYLSPSDDGSLFFSGERVGFNYGNSDSLYWESFGIGHKESLLAFKATNGSLVSTYVISHVNTWRLYHFHDTSSTAAVKQPGALNDNAALRADAGNLAAFLYLLQERDRGHYDQVVSFVRRVVPRFDDFTLRPDPLNPEFIQLEWREVESDFPFRAQHLSDGSLRFICLATLLMQPLPPPTIIIDEPELGLHPVAIELLAEMLRLASERTQVIIATQSPALVNAFTPEDIITVDRVEGATEFQRHTTESLAAWLEDYTLGELWEKNVIGGKP